jgi:predicted transposase/invertase (TIGR01784 family)
MERLNPLNDFLFRQMLGRPGDEEQLLSFLNATLAKTGRNNLQSIEIIENRILPPEILGGKLVVLDVRAQAAGGAKINVEVQLKNRYNMNRRSLFYWAEEYIRGLDAGQNYRDAPDVIAVNILDFTYMPLEEFHTSFHLWEDRHKDYMLTGAAELHFLEMPKFRRLAAKDIRGNPLHRWLSYFDRETPLNMVEEIVKMDPVIERAQKVMDKIMQDDDLLHSYHMYQMSLWDEESGRRGVREEGRKEGIRETAQKLKAMGLPPEQIIAATGLSPEALEKL